MNRAVGARRFQVLVALCSLSTWGSTGCTINAVDSPVEGDSQYSVGSDNTDQTDRQRAAQALELLSVIQSGERYSPRAQEGEVVLSGESLQDGQFFCTEREVSTTSNPEELTLLQPQSASLWIGNVVQGDMAKNGQLISIHSDLGPVTYSVSLQGGPKVVGQMAQGRLSDYRDSLNSLLTSNLQGGTGGASHITVHRISSESHLAEQLGVSVNWFGLADITTKLKTNFASKLNTILVDYRQSYYTVDADAYASPTDAFGATVTADELDTLVSPGNPAVYVKSITYGRRIVAAFSVSEEDWSRDFEAGIKSWLAVDGSAERVESDSVNNSEFIAYVMGDSRSATNMSDLLALIDEGAVYQPGSSGAALAYKLAYLEDNSPAGFSLNNAFTVRECRKNRATLKAELRSIETSVIDGVGANEIYGDLWLLPPNELANGTCRDPFLLNAQEPISENDPGPESEVSPVMLLRASEGFSGGESVIMENVSIGEEFVMCVGGHLWEEDTFEDDDLGEISREVIRMNSNFRDGHDQTVRTENGFGTTTVTLRITEL